MALTLPTTNTVGIKTLVGDKTIDLGFTVGKLLPHLTIPTLIDIAKNTSGVIPTGFSSMRFLQLAKTKATTVYKDGQASLDPAKIEARNIQVEVTQLAPCQIAEKIRMQHIDMHSPGFEDALAKVVGTWASEHRTRLEMELLQLLVEKSKWVQTEKIEKTHKQQDKDLKTLAQGAHFEAKDINTFNDAKTAFVSAVNTFRLIGLPNAKSRYDANNKFASGIMPNNLLCLVSYEFLDLLTSDKSLLTSDAGYHEIFKKLHLTNIYGIHVMPIATLPSDVYFVMINTGEYGTFAYEHIGPGLQIKVGPNPDWMQDLRADISLSYITGVVNDTYIISAVKHKYNKANISFFKTSHELKQQEEYFVD